MTIFLDCKYNTFVYHLQIIKNKSLKINDKNSYDWCQRIRSLARILHLQAISLHAL